MDMELVYAKANDNIMLSEQSAHIFIFTSTVIGLIFGLYNMYMVMSIDTTGKNDDNLLDTENENKERIITMNITAQHIQDGANTFLLQEYLYMGVFLVIFFIVIFIIDEFKFYTAFAFLIGCIISIISGYIGMYVATRTNVRVTYLAAIVKDESESLKSAFNAAFRGGCVMGFILVSLALMFLTIMIIIFKSILKPENNVEDSDYFVELFDYVAGYGLGGSTVALFCRVGGGIYTKAADVGADLVGKNEFGLDEDSPDNPATIADNVGDNVGDIAGMGSDLFGSFAESTCAALVVSGTSNELIAGGNFYYPLMISAGGIIVCLITSFFATHIFTVTEKSKIESSLRYQLIISSILLTPMIVFFSVYFLPEKFYFGISLEKGDIPISFYESSNWGVMICGLIGLWCGMIIGYFTDYFTSTEYSPVQNLAHSCKSGAAINIIQGLALGYLSCIIPIISLAITIAVSFVLANMYGIAIAALGMLSNLSISLAIDAYGPISDNAGGISEMSNFPKEVREKTDALDAAGNTTAAIGKGFAIGSACLVSLALFGAFLTRTKTYYVNILEPMQIACLLVGAMMPYAFSALTMKSVGTAASEMCDVVKRQINNRKGDEPLDYKECIQVSTTASLKEMLLPGVLVILTPLVIGMLFGQSALAGYLAGVIVSGVQMAISSSNSGGAWDNAKKYIEAERLKIHAEDRKMEDPEVQDHHEFFKKKTQPHKAAVVGDTVGDPLKDTSGPSINILIKLSSIVSLVFANFIKAHALFPDIKNKIVHK